MDIRMPSSTHRGHPAPHCPRRAGEVLILTTFDLDEYVFDALAGRGGAGSCSDTPAGQSPPPYG